MIERCYIHTRADRYKVNLPVVNSTTSILSGFPRRKAELFGIRGLSNAVQSRCFIVTDYCYSLHRLGFYYSPLRNLGNRNNRNSMI